jgi:phospholipase/carboxylesterase
MTPEKTAPLEAIEIETRPSPSSSVVWLHGLGADGNDFVPIVPELELDDLALRFVFPHAPTRPVTINGGMVMRAWYDISDQAIRIEDEKSVRASQAQVEALVQRERARGSSRVVLAGFSQGGAIALHTGLRQERKLAGIMALSCYLPLAAQASEITEAGMQTPIFMAHGVSDPVVVHARAVQSRDLLVQLGCKVEWHEYAMPHSVSMEEIADVGAWLRRIFG